MEWKIVPGIAESTDMTVNNSVSGGLNVSSNCRLPHHQPDSARIKCDDKLGLTQRKLWVERYFTSLFNFPLFDRSEVASIAD